MAHLVLCFVCVEGVFCCVRSLVFVVQITLSSNRGSYLFLCKMCFIISYSFFLSMLFRG